MPSRQQRRRRRYSRPLLLDESRWPVGGSCKPGRLNRWTLTDFRVGIGLDERLGDDAPTDDKPVSGDISTDV
jgi:hypothetical protein